jgi:hypothetical protein
MKRFNELTKSQQDEAVNFATLELKECIDMGIVSFDKPVDSHTLTQYATIAAEDAFYAEIGDKVIDDIIT